MGQPKIKVGDLVKASDVEGFVHIDEDQNLEIWNDGRNQEIWRRLEIEPTSWVRVYTKNGDETTMKAIADGHVMVFEKIWERES